MGFIHNWKVLTVLRALLGVFEAGCKCFAGPAADELELIHFSIPWGCVHYWVVVSPVRDSEKSIGLLHGSVVGIRVWTDRKR
jgi:hypothetical protein